MKPLLLTHDFSCVFAELARAAKRYTLPRMLSSGRAAMDDLAVAAVALTIQLAIDVADRDPIEMRALERELISKLKAAL